MPGSRILAPYEVYQAAGCQDMGLLDIKNLFYEKRQDPSNGFGADKVLQALYAW